MNIAALQTNHQNLLPPPISLLPNRRDKVQFPYRNDIEIVCFFGTALFFFLLLYLFRFCGPGYEAKNFIYPCNISTTIQTLNTLRQTINSTQKEMETQYGGTIFNPTVKLNGDELTRKYIILTTNYIQLEEKWIHYRNIYFECYKTNILKHFYRKPGYFIIAYYILITLLFTKLFVLLKKAKSCDLTEVQLKTVNGFYMNAMVFWSLHLIASPFLVWLLFYSDDISAGFKNEFPIYPHNDWL